MPFPTPIQRFLSLFAAPTESVVTEIREPSDILSAMPTPTGPTLSLPSDLFVRESITDETKAAVGWQAYHCADDLGQRIILLQSPGKNSVTDPRHINDWNGYPEFLVSRMAQSTPSTEAVYQEPLITEGLKWHIKQQGKRFYLCALAIDGDSEMWRMGPFLQDRNPDRLVESAHRAYYLDKFEAEKPASMEDLVFIFENSNDDQDIVSAVQAIAAQDPFLVFEYVLDRIDRGMNLRSDGGDPPEWTHEGIFLPQDSGKPDADYKFMIRNHLLWQNVEPTIDGIFDVYGYIDDDDVGTKLQYFLKQVNSKKRSLRSRAYALQFLLSVNGYEIDPESFLGLLAECAKDRKEYAACSSIILRSIREIGFYDDAFVEHDSPILKKALAEATSEDRLGHVIHALLINEDGVHVLIDMIMNRPDISMSQLVSEHDLQKEEGIFSSIEDFENLLKKLKGKKNEKHAVFACLHKFYERMLHEYFKPEIEEMFRIVTMSYFGPQAQKARERIHILTVRRRELLSDINRLLKSNGQPEVLDGTS